MTAQQILMQKYGEPDEAYQNKYCELWQVQERFAWFPVKRIFINTDFRKKLEAAFVNIEKAGLQGEIKTFDGCYNQRSVRGADSTSLHAWAAAIDINAGIEQMGKTTTNFSGQFIAIMKAQGLYWGGDWNGRKDTMHFALYNG